MRAIMAIEEYIKQGEIHWSLGIHNDFLFDNKVRQDFFNTYTDYRICIMDDKTYDTIPYTFVNKIFIVYSTDENYKPKHNKNKDPIVLVRSINEIFEQLHNYNKNISSKDDSIIVCGGKEIYDLLLPYCEFTYISKNTNREFYDSNKYIVDVKNFDKKEDGWKCVTSQIMTDAITKKMISLYRYHNKDMKIFPMKIYE